ncbi:MAG: prlC [Betaproteobacteria bacterium]|nr:prlC [Betaproteobacteria bacterium]
MPINPLLDFAGLPRFDAFKTEYVTPAVDRLLADARSVMAELCAATVSPDWDNFVSPLYDATEKLNRAWGQVGHLNAVMNSPELREVYNANLPKVTQFYTEYGQNQRLFERFKELDASPAMATLTPARRAVIEHELRDFRLGGADLPADKKQRFMAVREKLSALTSRFSDNVLDATNAFGHYVEAKEALAGLPADALEAAHEAAAADGKPGWKFTLHAPSFMPVMQYADNRALRETLYRAYATRAAEFGKPEWDNTALINEIVGLRRELAQLLGFASFAEYSLEPKMAESPQQVLQFLSDLAGKAKPFAQRDLVELKQFAREEWDLPDLQSWDISYASEKLRNARYAFSDQEVKQYFPETTVLPGMFRVVETLYGVSIEPTTGVPAWHPDVRFFSIRDAAHNLIGQFYLDLYARPSKRGGAWMDDAITRRRTGGGIQTPVAYLNCNFAPPVGEVDGKKRPAVFTHDEVITLFHEFGHGLHHLLTRIDELGVAGINGVEWDAVELPSQFMENFCWEWDALMPLTQHVDTGAPLPRALFDKMLAAKNFQSGMQMVRQIEFSLFDVHLHFDFDPAGAMPVQALIDDVRRQVAVIIPPAFNRFAQSFTHIFAGGYAAGYYSYKWAEVLSADAFSLFEERGVFDAKTGARFRDEILAVGGSRSALDSFVAFRGRPPSIDALLRHNGMTAAAAA